MMRLVIILALVALVVAIWLRRRGGPVETPTPKPERRRIAASEYQSVSIQPGPGACQAAQDRAGEIFLVNEAPLFPLSGCEVENCRCSYRQEGDRRQSIRRRADVGLPELDVIQHEEERRDQDRRG